jgi:hypothetical protein
LKKDSESNEMLLDLSFRHPGAIGKELSTTDCVRVPSALGVGRNVKDE